METTAKRLKVTKGEENLSQKELLLPGYPRYCTPETHSVQNSILTSQTSVHPKTEIANAIRMLKDQLNPIISIVVLSSVLGGLSL